MTLGRAIEQVRRRTRLGWRIVRQMAELGMRSLERLRIDPKEIQEMKWWDDTSSDASTPPAS